MSKKKSTIKGKSINELERACDKIHAWFFAYPEEEFSLNEIAQELKIAKTTANIVISQLAKDGFLNISKLGKLWRIKANQEHHRFTTRKIPFNLRIIYESGIIEWIEREIPSAKTIVLFGSYRKGDDIKSSDLDIAVEIPQNNNLDIWKVYIKNVGYRENVAVNIHLFSRKKVDLNLFANIANGIILKGFLEVQK
jgi:predicted nucleotidyltransferase